MLSLNLADPGRLCIGRFKGHCLSHSKLNAYNNLSLFKSFNFIWHPGLSRCNLLRSPFFSCGGPGLSTTNTAVTVHVAKL